MTIELHRTGYSAADLDKYAELFSACFPDAGKLGNANYLKWLYVDNPEGKVVGFNALEGDRLAAHYVCVPMRVKIHGSSQRVLLSLNTATHPDFQGKGLFTKLADLTYEAGASDGFAAVYGVANANSTPGFLRKLSFDLVSPLESKVGTGLVGDIAWDRAEEADFCTAWDGANLAWRLSNPANPLTAAICEDGSIGVSGKSSKPMIDAWAQIPKVGGITTKKSGLSIKPRVWLGLVPKSFGPIKGYAELPESLRPSPLNLIYRNLQGSNSVDGGNVMFSFLDFDAF